MEIAVQAAALNFKDVMNAMGLLAENAVSGGLAGPSWSGGRGPRPAHGTLVQHVQTGDEVIARVADGFSGRVIAPAHCVVRRPRTADATAGGGRSGRLHHGMVFVMPSGTDGARRDGLDPFGGRRRWRSGDSVGAAGGAS